MTGRRRLAAIVFTDIVGFAAAAQVNERTALESVRQHEQLVVPIVEGFQGRRVKSTGDGLLAEFGSAVQAAECALEIQRRVAEHNRLKGAAPFELRIGIHVGDVEEHDGDILGDAVNVAARVEPLAEPGGICVTRAVYEQVYRKIPAQLTPLEAVQLKHIDFPWEVYRLEPGPRPDTTFEDGHDTSGARRLAVLPFTNMSPEASDAYFADGLTEEMIMRLAGIEHLRVIARTSVMRFRDARKGVSEIGRELRVGEILEGSVRKAGDRIRVTAQLIDARSEEHLWAQQYDRRLEDILQIQSEIANEVATALQTRLKKPRSPTAKGAASVPAYTAYLRGRHMWHRGGPASVRQALELFLEASRLDPEFARAYAGISDCHLVLVGYDQVPEAEGLAQAHAAADRALQLDPLLPEGHFALANLFATRVQNDPAERHYQRAIRLQPDFSEAHLDYSGLLTSQGRLPEALEHAHLAEEADPVSSWAVGWTGYLAWASAKPEVALEKWTQAATLSGRRGRFDRMCFYALSGERQAAGTELESLVTEAPPEIHHWVPFWRAAHAAIENRREQTEAYLAEYLRTASSICSHRFIRAAVYGLSSDIDAAYGSLGDPRDLALGNWALYFRTHPGYVRFRQDPRFSDYIRPWNPGEERTRGPRVS